jgi:hypothetical protein
VQDPQIGRLFDDTVRLQRGRYVFTAEDYLEGRIVGLRSGRVGNKSEMALKKPLNPKSLSFITDAKHNGNITKDVPKC